jgi:hypothetical protein
VAFCLCLGLFNGVDGVAMPCAAFALRPPPLPPPPPPLVRRPTAHPFTLCRSFSPFLFVPLFLQLLFLSPCSGFIFECCALALFISTLYVICLRYTILSAPQRRRAYKLCIPFSFLIRMNANLPMQYWI